VKLGEQKVNILMDPQIFNQKFGGIPRYYSELYKGLKSHQTLKVDLPLLFSNTHHLQLNSFIAKSVVFLSRYTGLSAQKFWIKSLVLVKFKLKYTRPSLFIPSFYYSYFLNDLGKVPLVLTVHDMIHELFPNSFEDTEWMIVQKSILIQKANKIIAISNCTKNDILKFYPNIHPDKISVVYLGGSTDKSEKFIYFKDSNKVYILFVGQRKGYKNFVWFLKAVSDWLVQENISLLCIGGDVFDKEELQVIDALGLDNLVFHFIASDNELYGIYASALAFVFPSKYEGFGIPILEAMSSGCPVVLPPLSSFPEVAGDAGIYYENEDVISLVTQLKRLKSDSDFRQNYISRGYQRADNFSWSEMVDESLKVYQSVLA
jgi:glycosyltransferase involved in cell wall biosynthesis